MSSPIVENFFAKLIVELLLRLLKLVLDKIERVKRLPAKKPGRRVRLGK